MRTKNVLCLLVFVCGSFFSSAECPTPTLVLDSPYFTDIGGLYSKAFPSQVAALIDSNVAFPSPFRATYVELINAPTLKQQEAIYRASPLWKSAQIYEEFAMGINYPNHNLVAPYYNLNTMPTSVMTSQVSSREHYNDYTKPSDTNSAYVSADKSSLGGAHANNCIADICQTGFSSLGLRNQETLITGNNISFSITSMVNGKVTTLSTPPTSIITRLQNYMNSIAPNCTLRFVTGEENVREAIINSIDSGVACIGVDRGEEYSLENYLPDTLLIKGYQIINGTLKIVINESNTVLYLRDQPEEILLFDMNHTLQEFTEGYLYQFFNDSRQRYFHSGIVAELEAVRDNLGDHWKCKGAICKIAYAQTDETIPVYRFLNRNTNVHFYTANEAEKDNILETMPQMQLEGIGFYVYKQTGTKIDVPVHRFFVPESRTHVFSTDVHLADYISLSGNSSKVVYEGIAFFSRL